MLTLQPFPLWDDFRSYKLNFFWKDVIAGLSVALLALPQAMAYAFVAGLPPQVGIFSAIFGTILSATFGGSRFLVCGPTSQSAILLQAGIAEIIATYYGHVTGSERDMIAINILIQVVLISGVFQILGGLLRLGRLMQFTSRSVVVGYMLGVAFAIIMTQAFPFFGLPVVRGYHPLYEKVWIFIQRFPELHLWTTLVAVGSLALLMVLTHYYKRGPVPLIVFTLAAIVVAVFHLSPEGKLGVTDVEVGQHVERVTLLRDLGPLYTDHPKFKAPTFEMRTLGSILPLALAISLLGVLQATAIGRSYTRAKDPPYNDNQELYGSGISNVITSFIGAMPSAGSFARTAMSTSIGAKTRFSAIYSGVILFVIVFFLGPLVTTIPLAALSAMMFINAYNLVNFKDLYVCLRAARSDAFVLLITFMACILFSFDMALYIGIAVSIVLYLKQAGVPHLVEYAFNNVGKLRPLDSEDERPDSRIAIFQVEGELFFGAADLLQTKLRLIGEDESIKVIILQLLNARSVDASVCIAIKNVYRYLDGTGRIFLVSGVTDGVYDAFKESGVVTKIGADHLFMANEQLPSEPTRNAYAMAKQALSHGV